MSDAILCEFCDVALLPGLNEWSRMCEACCGKRADRVFGRPSSDEREKLASMRDELLQDDWAYWHDDPAVLFLNRLLPEHPPFVPEHMRGHHLAPLEPPTAPQVPRAPSGGETQT